MRIILVALVALLVSAGAAHASHPGQNGPFAVQGFCWDEGCPIFFTPGGGGITLPGAWPATEIQPENIAWSPDGRRLAFDGNATRLGTGRAIYVVNADGTGLTQVGRGDLRRYSPTWSPSGTKLAFVQDNGAGRGSGDIYTMTTSGSSLTRLTSAAAWEGTPDWAADGSRIAYSCRSGSRSQICQMTPTGGSKTVTTAKLPLPDSHPSGGNWAPSWSPDSRSIAFTTGGRVYTMTRAGGSLRDITPPDGEGERHAWRAAWSPDGTRVAIEQACLSAPCFGIRTVRLDGSDPQWVTTSEDGLPIDAGSWRPVR